MKYETCSISTWVKIIPTVSLFPLSVLNAFLAMPWLVTSTNNESLHTTNVSNTRFKTIAIVRLRNPVEKSMLGLRRSTDSRPDFSSYR